MRVFYYPVFSVMCEDVQLARIYSSATVELISCKLTKQVSQIDIYLKYHHQVWYIMHQYIKI